MGENLHVYDQGCTIRNPVNMCVDSPHTSDLSAPTHFHVRLAIKRECFAVLDHCYSVGV